MRKIGVVSVFIVCVTLPMFAGVDDNDTSGSPVIAVIDGAPLTFTFMEQKRAGSLFQARNNYYQAERKAIDESIDQYLLERQARKENVTVTELLERHVDHAIAKDPSDEAMRVYYEGLDTTQSFEALRGQMLDHIRERRLTKAKDDFMKSLRAQANIVVRLVPPRATVSLKDTPVRGPANAAVTIVEFADYECPYCQQIQPVLERLESEYKGKLALAYKDMPLPMHSHAQKAAEAARCAGTQNKYWEFHDAIYNGRQLEVPQLERSARDLGLDEKAFRACLSSGQQTAAVKAQMAEGEALQVQGTPSFFVNGRFFGGNLTYEQLRAIVEEELTDSRPRVADGGGH